jgi:hypothetical protein
MRQTPEQIAAELKRNPNRRRVDDQPPTLELTAGELEDLKQKRNAALTERAKLEQEARNFIRDLPDELRETYLTIQAALKTVDQKIRDLDKAIKSSAQFTYAVRKLKDSCAAMLGPFSVRGNLLKFDIGLIAAFKKCTARLPNERARSALRIAMSELVDPRVAGERAGMSYDEFLSGLKKSKAWALANEAMFEEYEREAIHSVDRAVRQDAINSIKQLGEVNRKQNLNPPPPRMKPKRRRKRARPALPPLDNEV